MRVNFSILGLYLAVIGSSMFYTLFIVWGITAIVPMEGRYYWGVVGVVFLLVSVFSLRFYIPRLRDSW
uniref:hypothetical protein n=1 Tax=Pseudomonas laurentiana TaxID=2364649 RepID=UPI0029C6F554|nr:hypothetical protein [Pseudomonas laurentiana]